MDSDDYARSSQTPNSLDGQPDFKKQLSNHYTQALGRFGSLNANKLVARIPDGASPEQIKKGVLDTSWPSAKSFGATELRDINLDGTAKVSKLLQDMSKANDALAIGKAYVGLLTVLDDNRILDTALPMINNKIGVTAVNAVTASPSRPVISQVKPKPPTM